MCTYILIKFYLIGHHICSREEFEAYQMSTMDGEVELAASRILQDDETTSSTSFFETLVKLYNLHCFESLV